MPLPVEFDCLRVVLVATRNPLNIGAVARAMSNFGFAHLRLVRPYDVAFREARSAVGAAEVLAGAEEFGSVAEAVADCFLVVGTTSVGHREPQHAVNSLEVAGPVIRAHLRAGPVALLFGSEKVGLSNDDLSHCHWLLRIPTRDAHASMNLGQAVAVCLYELLRAEGPTEPPALPEAATAESLDRVAAVLLDALSISGYVDASAMDTMENKARRLVRRMNLSSGDAQVLLGMLRQILWKLRRDG